MNGHSGTIFGGVLTTGTKGIKSLARGAKGTRESESPHKRKGISSPITNRGENGGFDF